MKKILLPEDINYCHGTSNMLHFKTVKDAAKMFDFCKDNNIKAEWSFAVEDDTNTSLIGIELKNAEMCPYELMCYKQQEGFDGIIVTIDTNQQEELKRMVLNKKA